MATVAPTANGALKGGALFGTIRWKVAADSITEQYIYSPSIDVGGMSWSICAKRTGGDLAVHLKKLTGSCTMRGINVAIEFKLINRKNDAHSIIKTDLTNSDCNHDLGFPQFARWNYIMNRKKGFDKYGKLTLQIHFWLSNIIGPRIDSGMWKVVDAAHDSAMLGTIHWEVDRDFFSNSNSYSPEIYVGGMWWSLRLQHLDTGYLSLSLTQKDGDYEMHSVDTSFEFTLIHRLDKFLNITTQDKKTYTKDQRSRGNSTFVTWNNVIDEKQRFIKNNKIKLQAEFSLSNLIGFRKLSRVDFGASRENICDITLIIQGKKIYANKQFLSIHSPFFHALFYSDFEEKNQEEIELKEIDHEELIELLNFVYPPSKKITEQSIDYLLRLADRFDIDWVVYQCEQYLITSSSLPLASKLVLASQYRLFDLQDHCFNQLNTIEDVKDLKKSDDYDNFSDEIKVSLFEKMMIL